jgi:hypothetical protein
MGNQPLQAESNLLSLIDGNDEILYIHHSDLIFTEGRGEKSDCQPPWLKGIRTLSRF